MGIPMQEWAASLPSACDDTKSPWFLTELIALNVAVTESGVPFESTAVPPADSEPLYDHV